MNPDLCPSSLRKPRIAAIDWMRGFVMILMTVDHASMAFNPGHNANDSASLSDPKTTFSTLEFLTRWVTHLCAPAFIFLAGTSIALSTSRRQQAGQSQWDIDKYLLSRGAFIALLDPTLVSFFKGHLTFQVLFAIGTSIMCMPLIRRLGTPWILVLVGLWFVAGDAITLTLWQPLNPTPPIWAALLFLHYCDPGTLLILYPLIPWLMIMSLGFTFGRHLNHDCSRPQRLSPTRLLVATGSLFLVAFFLLRFANGYGNAGLYQPFDQESWQWFLRVSKYPPSLTYMLLELGLGAIILAGMMVWEPISRQNLNSLLTVFGQTALFFYLLHPLVLELIRHLFGDLIIRPSPLGGVYLATLLTLAFLYPICHQFRRFKNRYHNSKWTSFL